MITVTYYASACVGITTPDVKVLCDPWFKDGIYDGAWYTYPKIHDPVGLIGEYDLIYISHIHPDHYDPEFLRAYLGKYPNAKMIIAPGVFLEKLMLKDGFKKGEDFEILKGKFPIYEGEVGETKYYITPNDTGSISDIDTALIVKWKDHCVVNMNDNPYWQPQVDRIKNLCPKIDIALLGYASAGPYPQTYYDDEETLSKRKDGVLKAAIYDRYLKFDQQFDAKVNIPFAGEYILGGKLARYNKWRAVCDAVDIYNHDPKAIVLQSGGEINTDTFTATAMRTEAYNKDELEKYIAGLQEPMDYEKDFSLPIDKIPFRKLLPMAYRNAHSKNEHNAKYEIAIKYADNNYFCMSLDQEPKFEFLKANKEDVCNYTLITIDYRYLFGLITGVYHWNNAEVGSQYLSRRFPDTYQRSVQRFLNFFVV